MPKVYNKHHKDAPPGAVYIGRGSPYGNPFHIGPKDGDRDEVCDKFEAMVEADPQMKAMFIAHLRDKDLVCFCAPLRCHGDYLLRIANQETRHGCPSCGGTMVGDGHTMVLHCENAEADISTMEPDAAPVYCTRRQE